MAPPLPLLRHEGTVNRDFLLDLVASFMAAAPNANVNLFYELAQDNIVARAGGGQALATPLTGQTCKVITVATVGDSVMLPPSAAGLEVLVINKGAKDMQVFGAGVDTIDDVATATGVSQMPNSLVIYSCATAGAWFSEGLATGYAPPGLQTLSSQDNITAKAGGGQYAPGVAPIINRMMNRVTIVASANDSLTLPPSAAGMQIICINAAGVNSMNVFPAAGEQINVLGANVAFAVAANKTATFYCVTAGQWHTQLTA